jgi:hypothetical protein
MAQAGLVRRPRRGFVQITDRGKAVLHSNPERVDNTVLAQFHEFTEFKSRSKATPTDSRQPSDGSDAWSTLFYGPLPRWATEATTGPPSTWAAAATKVWME